MFSPKHIGRGLLCGDYGHGEKEGSVGELGCGNNRRELEARDLWKRGDESLIQLKIFNDLLFKKKLKKIDEKIYSENSCYLWSINT